MKAAVRPGFIISILALIICYSTPSFGAKGVVGDNFLRPTEDFLKNGQTTYDQAISKMGNPENTGTRFINEKMLKNAIYYYSNRNGNSVHNGFTPYRRLFLTFHEGILVEHFFTSTWAEDHTDFDETKIKEIVKGKTTRAEVIKLMGRPSGIAIYPLVALKSYERLAYIISATSVNGSTQRTYFKRLLILIDPKGTVTEVDFTSSGSK